MNHEKLEGKIIEYDTRMDSVGVINGKVLLADPDIGLTIVAEDDPDHYLLCLICKGSPKWFGDERDDSESQELFNLLCTYIEQGKIDNYEFSKFFKLKGSDHGHSPSEETCAFA